MRLIDADALEVDWYDDYETEDGDEYSYAYVSKYQIDEAPTVDAVPYVVRCKDCKWFGKIGCAIEIVDETDRPKENDFCSFAERRNNATD